MACRARVVHRGEVTLSRVLNCRVVASSVGRGGRRNVTSRGSLTGRESLACVGIAGHERVVTKQSEDHSDSDP